MMRGGTQIGVGIYPRTQECPWSGSRLLVDEDVDTTGGRGVP